MYGAHIFAPLSVNIVHVWLHGSPLSVNFKMKLGDTAPSSMYMHEKHWKAGRYVGEWALRLPCNGINRNRKLFHVFAWRATRKTLLYYCLKWFIIQDQHKVVAGIIGNTEWVMFPAVIIVRFMWVLLIVYEDKLPVRFCISHLSQIMAMGLFQCMRGVLEEFE